MNRPIRLAAVAVAAVVLAATWAASAPQPKTIPTEWELQGRFQTPQPIQVTVPGETDRQIFWYVLYTTTNTSGDDRIFVPDFTLYTDTGQVLHGAEGISPSVFEAIQLRHNNPLLNSVSAMTGQLLQGLDNAKDGVAIFLDIDPQARAFDLFIGGLSGETVGVKLPMKVIVLEADVEGRPVKALKDTILLRKAWQLTYQLPGDAGARFSAKPRMASSRWVMR